MDSTYMQKQVVSSGALSYSPLDSLFLSYIFFWARGIFIPILAFLGGSVVILWVGVIVAGMGGHMCMDIGRHCIHSLVKQ